MTIRLLHGDARDVLKTLPAESVHTVVTSPPYYALRDYGVAGQIGLERTPAEYIAEMVGVFREVRRVLRNDGTLWLNIGDSYAGSGKGPSNSIQGKASQIGNSSSATRVTRRNGAQFGNGQAPTSWISIPAGLKPKDLIGIPWMLAFALRDDGWYLRSDIIWSKPNPMPESVADRPTKAHEYLFLLSKSRTYAYDADAIRESVGEPIRMAASFRDGGVYTNNRSLNNSADKAKLTHGDGDRSYVGRNKRSVWEIATEAFPEAHFATYPTALVEPCIKAGCPTGGTVLDPFAGAGTTLLVADRLQRNAIGIELNAEYIEIARKRLFKDAPMFTEVEVA